MQGGVAIWPSLGHRLVGAHEITVQVGGHALGLFGASRFALLTAPHDAANLTMFLFSAVFMDTAATIPTGAMAERWKFSAFLVYGLFMSMLLYPLYGNWVWGGGWLAAMGTNWGLGHGHVDFAGSSVVHMTGGLTALAGAIVLGPRAGKFRRDGTIGAIPGHNLPMTIIGTLILAFGWFGFNAGSTLAGADPRIATIAVNTMLASSAGAVTALVFVWYRLHKPDVAMACNGLLGGLVAITAPCAFVSPAAAVLIGLASGVLVVHAVFWVETRFRIDDPVGAFAVHGVCGAWGAMSVGLFADGTYGVGWNGVAGPVRGLLFGDGSQLCAQLIGVITNIVFVFPVAYGFFRIVGRLMGNRVPAEVEWSGLDSSEMGSEAYPPG
jgi:Amt family ammonium transporter